MAAIAAGRPAAPDPITTTSASWSQVSPLFIVVAVVPLVVAVAVRLLGDVRGELPLLKLLLELLADPRLLVRVGDLLVRQVALLIVAGEYARRAERDVPRRIRSDVEVLVVPLVGRGEH